jgi:D-alanyl-D-alanine carboxypeptidase (penicillin-binding protein 5/6)
MKNTLLTLILLVIIPWSLLSAEEYPGTVLPSLPGYLSKVPGGELESPGPLTARGAVVMDYQAQALIYEKNADLVIPPASLTKLMTVHLALEAAGEGRFSLSERVPVPEAAWAQNQPYGSSLMFLGPGQRVSGEELLYGLAVSSGNDAAVAVAILVSGSVDAFVSEMNEEARRLGYRNLSFRDPAGLSAANRATPRELADFAGYLIHRHPRILDYFSLPEFTYPRPENFTNGHRERSITQANRNVLLSSYPGADGFKTGFIEASRYNLLATAEREGRRIITVVLGVPGASHAEGGERRAKEAARLMDFAFERFELVTPRLPPLEPLRVYGGVAEEVAVEAEPIRPLVLPKGFRERLAGRYRLDAYRWAPVPRGTVVGTIEYTLNGSRVLRRSVATAAEVPRDGLLGRIYDGLMLLTAPLVE